MPDFYANGEYDLSGFAVGIVKKDSVIDGKNITAGDVLIGLPSSGVHSNGFSLVRRFAKKYSIFVFIFSDLTVSKHTFILLLFPWLLQLKYLICSIIKIFVGFLNEVGFL